MSRHHLCDEELDSHVPLLTDHDRHGLQDDNHSPALSTLSTQSHEIKYIFEPCTAQVEREAECNSDYSHINIRPKLHVGETSFLGRPPPYNRYEHEGNVASHYGFQHGLVSGSIQRFRSQPQTFSLEDVSGYDPTRRKSWSPPFSRQNVQGYQAGHKNVRGCHSSNMIDWEIPQQGISSYEPHGYNPQGHPSSHPQGYPPAHWQGHQQGHSQGHMQGHMNSTETECLPPRLAPVSGVLSGKLSKNLIRPIPIAFKPAYPRSRSSICQQCGEENALCSCQSFVGSHSHPQSQHPCPEAAFHHRSPSVRSANTSQLSVHSVGDCSSRSMGYSNEAAYVADDSPGVSVDQSPPRKASVVCSDVPAQTPSPSDSGVGELEAMLKEREAEILTLRQVMDRNERAIFQVYEEKKSRWLQDMREIKEEYERKLKVQQQKANKLEQALALQVRRLQQDKQQTHGKYSNLQAEKDAAVRHSQNQIDTYSSEPESAASSMLSLTPQKLSCSSVQSSPGDLSQQMLLQEEVAMKNTEIIALRSQLQELQGQLEDKSRRLSQTMDEAVSRSEELTSIREQLDQLSGVDRASLCEESTQTGLSDLSGEDSPLRPVLLSEEEYTRSLERQIDTLREQLQAAEALVESERMQWLEEKNKVIRYQKQLQLNYVQMQRKNMTLEAEVEQLTLELESRDLKLVALNGEESVC